MLGEESSLPDTKLMLLIHHSEFEIVKVYIVLQQSVSTDDDIDLSVSQFSFDIIFLFRSSGTREQLDTDAQREKEFG